MPFYFDKSSFFVMSGGIIELDAQEEQAAAMLAALGNASRLRIFRLLVRAGPEGVPVGEIQQSLEIPASTLSHHIAALKQACLVVQRREGRTIFSSANYAHMDGLIAYLTEECCVASKLGASHVNE